MTWWEGFFDDDYARIWARTRDDTRSDAEVEQIIALLGLPPGARVLDAPCGYGRIARRLAARGFDVVGLDQSAQLLRLAEAEKPDGAALAYRRHDLREPIAEGGFAAVLNLFSSFGYGTEDEDRAIFVNQLATLAPGGALLLESAHRDNVVVNTAFGRRLMRREPDGTIVIEEPAFDPVRGVVQTTWHWAGPAGVGSKSATLRVYAFPELVRLVESAGAVVRGVYGGLDGGAPTVVGDARSTRAVIVAERRA